MRRLRYYKDSEIRDQLQKLFDYGIDLDAIPLDWTVDSLWDKEDAMKKDLDLLRSDLDKN